MNRIREYALATLLAFSPVIVGCSEKSPQDFDDPANENPDTGATALDVEAPSIIDVDTIYVQRVGGTAIISSVSLKDR